MVMRILVLLAVAALLGIIMFYGLSTPPGITCTQGCEKALAACHKEAGVNDVQLAACEDAHKKCVEECGSIEKK